ncbi:MAG: ABC transporter ATP-binding protein [Rhodospirillaceae bacterium]|jgi:lipoprotein-releasing system ATP-binding protein|nr:ABC transporter ATP-binding protein [Rhodospirillaceae bacterium]MBT6509796.1 ABC transporter ATP-binding protein [Rhodospirillaceae bacterium]MBT7613814.1 ABC transporter ATP-binding protein [Rhodospirillaceae bacterium]MBT7646188.1 ABC transporter ATP-binding protein [Rhodospirillaceae bacterium]MDG2269470.1 ABC transporter ATP-binding protein [Alphaproteobacteria bacterium]
MSEAALGLRNIGRTFIQGDRKLEVLKGADMTLNRGEIVALVGPSGAGKSTLLYIAGLLEAADDGEIAIAGEICDAGNDASRTILRRKHLGFVYQFHHLLPEFSALENVVLPQLIAGQSKRSATARSRELLEGLGLAERLEHRPARLSGGEQQRVAIARALANQPAVLLADEPTGNLDPETADCVMNQLTQEVRGRGLAALVATHNMALAGRMDRILRLEDGRLIEG